MGSDYTRTSVGCHRAGRRLGGCRVHAAHDLAFGDCGGCRLRHLGEGGGCVQVSGEVSQYEGDCKTMVEIIQALSAP